MVSGFTILEFTVLGLKWLRVEVLSFYIPEPSADLSAHRMGPHNIGAVMARVDVKLGRRRFVPFERDCKQQAIHQLCCRESSLKLLPEIPSDVLKLEACGHRSSAGF